MHKIVHEITIRLDDTEVTEGEARTFIDALEGIVDHRFGDQALIGLGYHQTHEEGAVSKPTGDSSE